MSRSALWTWLALLLLAGVAQAGTVGSIAVCYFCTGPTGNNFGFGVQDAPIFQFTNSSGNDITNASFTIQASGDNPTADTFNIGTIAAGASFDLFVGVTDDGGTSHTFFAKRTNGLDTSDFGPDSNAVAFEFSGMSNGSAVLTGVFTAGQSTMTALDGTVSGLNFLGGPNGADGPCNNCYYNADVVNISTVASATPEPGSLLLLASGLAGLAGMVRRRR